MANSIFLQIIGVTGRMGQLANKMEYKMNTPNNNLKTVRQFLESYPAFTNGCLRNLLFYEGLNGLKACGATKRLGRKILIDCEKFFAWLDTNPSITGRGANNA